MNRAKSLAADHLFRAYRCRRDQLRLVDELTQCRRSGWVFFYEAQGPVVVSHHGVVHLLDGDRPAADVLAEFERSPVAR